MSAGADPARGPRVCVIGSFPPGALPTQGEELGSRLSSYCSRVAVISGYQNRFVRLLHVAGHLLLFGLRYDTLCVQVYGRRALLLEAVAIVLGKALRRRVVLHLHAGGLPAGLDRRPFPARWIYGLADDSVCPSAYMRRELARHGLVPRIIPNALDTAGYLTRPRHPLRPHLLWLRTFHPFYNPMLALRVFDLVRRRHPEARLTMAGIDCGSFDEVREAAAKMGLPVEFRGRIPRAEIPALMDTADIYLSTTRLDNTPVTVIEALLCGLAVVATNVGGIPDLLEHEQTGLLVGDDDAEGFSAAIDRLLAEPELAGRVIAQGRRMALGFAWEETLPLWATALAPHQRRASDAGGSEVRDGRP